MKSLAEQLREFMDQVGKTQKPTYQYTVTVLNWEECPDEEEDPAGYAAWTEERNLGVNAEVTEDGVYINNLYDYDTGVEITGEIPSKTLDKISDLVEEEYLEDAEEYNADMALSRSYDRDY